MNGGEKILLRLRPAHAPDTFYDEANVVQTMLHEAKHLVSDRLLLLTALPCSSLTTYTVHMMKSFTSFFRGCRMSTTRYSGRAMQEKVSSPKDIEWVPTFPMIYPRIWPD